MARVVAQKLSDALHQPFLVDNRGGGGGTIGTRAVARATPDGYTLLLGHTATISINPSLYVNLNMDPRKDFAPIGLIASMPIALLAHPSFPAKTVAEVISLAKKDAGKLNIGTSPAGTGGYMSAELFKAEAGLDVAIIPYKGTAPVMNDLVGGHVLVAFGVLPPALGNLQAGTLRRDCGRRQDALLAATRRVRPSMNPVCLVSKPCCATVSWLRMVRHPRLSRNFPSHCASLPRIQTSSSGFAMKGGDPLTSTAAEYADDIDKEEKKWGALVRRLNLKVD